LISIHDDFEMRYWNRNRVTFKYVEDKYSEYIVSVACKSVHLYNSADVS